MRLKPSTNGPLDWPATPHSSQGSAQLKPTFSGPLDWPAMLHSSQGSVQLKPTSNGPLEWPAMPHSSQGSVQLKLKTSKVVDWVVTPPVMEGFEMLKYPKWEQRARCMTENNTTATEQRRHLNSRGTTSKRCPVPSANSWCTCGTGT